jgi:hypothetical protein
MTTAASMRPELLAAFPGIGSKGLLPIAVIVVAATASSSPSSSSSSFLFPRKRVSSAQAPRKNGARAEKGGG